MQKKVNIFRSQWGGSTLIGLILGLCLGMLALIRWPHLEASIRSLLTEDDIKILAEGTLDSGLRPILPVLGELTPDAPVKSESSVILTANASLHTAEALAAEYRNEINPTAPSGYETREVWKAFSSESAAQAFATVVSRALGIEVETLRQSDHKFIPIVRCEGPAGCDVLTAKIAAFLAGSSDLEVYDEI